MRTNFSADEMKVFDLANDLARGDFSIHVDKEKVTRADLENFLRDKINNDILKGATLYQAYRRNNIVLFGTIGASLGAIINYLLAMWLGRPIIYAFADSKLGHLCLLSGEKIKKAEDYFNEHGKVSTFVGRLIPGIRQLISIPAGLCKMHFGWFLFYTFLGAGIWNVVKRS